MLYHRGYAYAFNMSSKRNQTSTASKFIVSILNHGNAPTQEGVTVYELTLFKHADGRSPYFYCLYQHPITGKQSHFSCRTEVESTARTYASIHLPEVLRNAYNRHYDETSKVQRRGSKTPHTSPPRTPITLSEFCSSYITERRTKQGHPLKPSSQKAILDTFNQLIKHSGDKYMSALTKEDCRAFIEGRTQSKRSAQKHHCNLSSAFDEAMRQGIIIENFFHNIKKPIPKYTDEEIDARCFDEEDFSTIIARLPLKTHAERRLRNMLILIHETGVRNSELRHIRLDRIDLDEDDERKTLHIKTDREFSTKTARSSRAIPLSDMAIEVIHAQINDNATHRRPEVRQSPFLFPNEQGQPLSHAGFWSPFNKARKSTLSKTRPKIHGLRHALVTRLSAEGVEDRMIQGITGQSLEMLARYSHMNRRHIEPAREAMNRGKKYDIR